MKQGLLYIVDDKVLSINRTRAPLFSLSARQGRFDVSRHKAHRQQQFTRGNRPIKVTSLPAALRRMSLNGQ